MKNTDDRNSHGFRFNIPRWKLNGTNSAFISSGKQKHQKTSWEVISSAFFPNNY